MQRRLIAGAATLPTSPGRSPSDRRRDRLSSLILLVALCVYVPQIQSQTTAPAASAHKVALVIGNGAYETAVLKNPVNDARAMAKLLRELGFDVLIRENITNEGFIEALRAFAGRVRPGDVSLFYFAGHGMQVNGRNYLIPVRASIESEDEVPYRAIDANQVLDKMGRANSTLNLVILDACRNNPFIRSFRAQINGLAHMEAPSGTLIAFATSPGSVAADGDGANSTYTKHLLANIASPGVPVEIALKRVREGVSQETLGRQIPWESSSIMGDFYFRAAQGGEQVAAAEPAKPQRDPGDSAYEMAYWDSVKNSSNAADFKAYLDQFPKGRFTALARNRLAILEPQVAAARSTTLGTSSPLSNLPSVGDTWTYDLSDRGRKVDTLTVSITGVSQEGRVTEKLTRARFPNFSASRTFEPEFNPRAYQEIDTPGQMFLPEFSPYVAPDPSLIGKKWEDLTPALTAGEGHAPVRRETWPMKLEIVGTEKIRVPAGEFVAIKVQGITIRTPGNAVGLKLTYWYAPQVKRMIRFKRELDTMYQSSRQEEIYELASYKLKE